MDFTSPLHLANTVSSCSWQQGPCRGGAAGLEASWQPRSGKSAIASVQQWSTLTWKSSAQILTVMKI